MLVDLVLPPGRIKWAFTDAFSAQALSDTTRWTSTEVAQRIVKALREKRHALR